MKIEDKLKDKKGVLRQESDQKLTKSDNYSLSMYPTPPHFYKN